MYFDLAQISIMPQMLSVDYLLLVLNPEYFMQDTEILIRKDSLYIRFVFTAVLYLVSCRLSIHLVAHQCMLYDSLF